MQPTKRTRVRRAPKRGVYDLQAICGILDAHFLCHIGIIDGQTPVVIPTLYGRNDDQLYIHGATSSRLLNTLLNGPEICLTVTLVDGFVMARSAFHHSMNYRSVVLYGKATLVSDEEDKIDALKIISDHIAPGRWEEVRGPNKKELKATNVLSIPIIEASAKIRTGPPADDVEDYSLDVWAGVVPLRLHSGNVLPDPKLSEGIGVSAAIENLRNKHRDD